MEGIAAEVSHKLKSAIKAKLMELGAYVDDELSNYVMVMVTNRRSKAEMDRELQLFLGANTSTFTTWLQSVWIKLEQVTVKNSGFENKRKIGGEKKKRNKKGGNKSSSESDEEKKFKKKRKFSPNESVTKDTKKRKLSKATTIDRGKSESRAEDKNPAESHLSRRSAEKMETTLDAGKRNILVTNQQKRNKDTVVEDEDFLNIKADFDSEFLSDVECAEVKTLPDEDRKLKKLVDGGVSVPDYSNLETCRENSYKDKSSSMDDEAPTNTADSATISTRRHSRNESDKSGAKIDRSNSATLLQSNAKLSTKEYGGGARAVSVKNELNRERNVKLPPFQTNFESKISAQESKFEFDRARTRKSELTSTSRSRSRSRSRSESPSFSQSGSSSSPPSPSSPLYSSRSGSGSPLRLRRSNSPSAFAFDGAKIGRKTRDSRSSSGGKCDVSAAAAFAESECRSSAVDSIKKYAKIRDNACPSMVDARELINRKRAMVYANEKLSRKRTLSAKTTDGEAPLDVETLEKRERYDSRAPAALIRFKTRDRSKENVNVADSGAAQNVDVDDDSGGGGGNSDKRTVLDAQSSSNFDRDGRKLRFCKRNDKRSFDVVERRKMVGGKYDRFVVSKCDGKRSITVRSAALDGKCESSKDGDRCKTAINATDRDRVSIPETSTTTATPGASAVDAFSNHRGGKFASRPPSRRADDNDERTTSSSSSSSSAAKETEQSAVAEKGNYDAVELSSDDFKFKKEDKFKLQKSVLNQINKYIKEEPVAVSNIAKSSKLARGKPNAVPTVTGTLIRKAVADAHKSLAYSKDELSKKKEVLPEVSRNATVSRDLSQENKATITVDDDDDDDDDDNFENSDSCSLKDGADQVDSKASRSVDSAITSEKYSNENEDVDDDDDDDTNRRDEPTLPSETEEYDPSKNMPQFVVTLTGLDPKLFSLDDGESDILDHDLDESKLKLSKSQERCKFYPNCLAGEQCLFYHPVIPCKMFPNCKYGNNCLYVHPRCRFDTACNRYDCTFLHSVPKPSLSIISRHTPSVASVNSQPCKFYYTCVNPLCPFQHPKICRFDRFCANKHCTFSHTSLSHVYTFSKDKLKWCRPKEIENKGGDTTEQKTDYDGSIDN